MLSRGDVEGVLQQARQLGLRPRRLDVPAEWRAVLSSAAGAAAACRQEHAHAERAASPRASPRAVPAAGGPEAAALRAAQAQAAEERASLRERYMNAATVDGTGGLSTTGVRWWLKYVVLGRGRLPFTRLSARSSLEDKVEAEQLLMDFVLWLALCRPSGRPISARTIKKYVSQVRAWHRRALRTELCGDLDFTAVNDLIKGVCRLVQQPPLRERWGVRTQQLAVAVGRYLSSETASSATWAAALTVAFCGLLRGAEFALQPGEAFDVAKHLTRGDIRFEVDAQGREYLALRMRIAKRTHGRGKDTTLLIGGGGSLLDPVAAVKRMLRLDPLTPGRRRFDLWVTVSPPSFWRPGTT